jgi:pSer/pThr/pTyr-binding forkhead associated (FHA) protein
MRAQGVDVRLNEEVDEAVGDRGYVRAVRLRRAGGVVPCQLVGTALGIRPNVAWLASSGVAIGRGVQVDDRARTSVDGIFAAGDVAEAPDGSSGARRLFGLWEPARMQGRVAGMIMAGRDAVFRLGALYTATRLMDADFATVGETIERPSDQVVIDRPRGLGRFVYRKLIVRDGRLVGALMLGPKSEAVRRRGQSFKRLVDARIDVTRVAERLLDPWFDVDGWIEMERGDAPVVPAPERRGMSTGAYVVRLSQVAAQSRAALADLMRPSGLFARSALPESAGAAAVAERALVATVSIRRTGQTLPLGDVTTVGRDERNDVVLADPEVSSAHAEFRKGPEGFAIHDLTSRNGTYLNDRRVAGAEPLAAGDIVRLGGSELIFRIVRPAALRLPLSSVGATTGSAGSEDAVAGDPRGGGHGWLEVDGRRIELAGRELTIGRDPASGCTLASPSISYQHAQLTAAGGSIYVRDLGSLNGTFVNRSRVTVPHPLREGDVIHVGDTDVTFHAPATAARPVRDPDVAGGRWVVVVLAGHDAGARFPLQRDSIRVGREQSCQVALTDATVSRLHARLDRLGGGWSILDLDSANGTSVNGRPLPSQTGRRIGAGDEILVGDVLLRLEEDP